MTTVSGDSLNVTIKISRIRIGFIIICVSFSITGLQPFTNYRVSVQASNAPVVDYGPALSGVFATLPEIPPGVDPPTVAVPQAGVGSSEIVEIVIPAPTFTQDHLRYRVYIQVWLTVVDFTLCSKFCMSCELPWTVYASARSACMYRSTHIEWLTLPRVALPFDPNPCSLPSIPSPIYPTPLQSPVGGVHQKHSPNN